MLKTIDLKLGDVTSEEAAAKMQVEDHTRARDALVQELQSKSGLSKGRHDDAMDWESSQGRGDSRDEHSRKKKYCIFIMCANKQWTNPICRPESTCRAVPAGAAIFVNEPEAELTLHL